MNKMAKDVDVKGGINRNVCFCVCVCVCVHVKQDQSECLCVFFALTSIIKLHTHSCPGTLGVGGGRGGWNFLRRGPQM